MKWSERKTGEKRVSLIHLQLAFYKVAFRIFGVQDYFPDYKAFRSKQFQGCPPSLPFLREIRQVTRQSRSLQSPTSFSYVPLNA